MNYSQKFELRKTLGNLGSYTVFYNDHKIAGQSNGPTLKRKSITYHSKNTDNEYEIITRDNGSFIIMLKDNIYAAVKKNIKMSINDVTLRTHKETSISIRSTDIGRTFLIKHNDIKLGFFTCDDWLYKMTYLEIADTEFIDQILCSILIIAYTKNTNLLSYLL